MNDRNAAQRRGPAKGPGKSGTVKGGSRLHMRNWRLRSKVIAVLVVPALTVLALAGLSAKSDLDRAGEFRQTVSQVDLARNVTRVVHELQKERTLYVARVANDDKGAPSAELAEQISRVDQAVTDAQESAANLDTDDEAAGQRYSIGLQRLSALESIRTTADNTEYPDVAVFQAYSAVLDAIVRLGREINTSVTDRDLLRDGTIIQAVSEAKENVAKENALLQIAAAHDAFPADTLDRIRDAQASAAGAVANFRAYASSQQQQLYSDTVAGTAIDNREALKASAIANAETSTAENQIPLGIDVTVLNSDGTATVERMRAVETDLLDDLRADATTLANDVTESAWRGAAIVLGALLIALILTLVVTNSLLKPLRVLRREALAVANHKLPASVQRILADPNPQEAAKHAVEPVPVFTREETGELARSFDAVQEQAVLMATEQALLRDNINSIFVNLSRRSQALVERQLALIDRLEQDEQDPDQLASLFELDHLATRMRRNSESLLVLSGTGLSRQLSRPVPASDVVGAAVSEVEHYARIEVASAPDVAVQGRAVSDLVHVIAELLDNATFFSPADKKVIVRMAMTRKKELAIQITDQGVGMSEDEIAATNARLADPPDLDVAVTRRMGLYVVARLAKRHNVTVRLRDNEDIEGGLIARITVPAELVQPIGAPPRSMSTVVTPSMSAPSTTGSLAIAGETSTDSQLNPRTAAPSRNSGIAGAFGGGSSRVRPEGPHTGADISQDRSAAEVASYPPFTTGYEGSSETTTTNGVPPQPPAATEQNGHHDPSAANADTGTALFGAPLPESHVVDTGYQQPYQGGTGNTPAGEAELNVDAPTERLPIYEAVLSQWFETADTGSATPRGGEAPAEVATNGNGHNGNGHNGNGHNGAGHNGAGQHGNGHAPSREAEPVEPTPWTSPGDDGWLAAQALLEEKAPETTTNAGLPKRVPKAHLVPGSAAPRHEAKDQPGETPAPTPPPLPPRTADAVRGRMSSFQQGVRRGRHALIEAYAGDQSGSEHSRKDEEQE